MARKSKDFIEFEWDKGNIDKNWVKHRITNVEAERIFADEYIFVTKDVKHSTKEARYQALGRTSNSRYLAVYYTFRHKKIRIISVRVMNRKEKNNYEKQKSI